MSGFKLEIDFFEYSFLLESCIPPRPIARTMFFQESTDIHYYSLSENERAKLWKWMNRNSSFQDSLKKNEGDVKAWNARYKPDNKFMVRCEGQGGKEIEHECFLLDGKYHTASHRWIPEEYVLNVTKIESDEQNNEH